VGSGCARVGLGGWGGRTFGSFLVKKNVNVENKESSEISGKIPLGKKGGLGGRQFTFSVVPKSSNSVSSKTANTVVEEQQAKFSKGNNFMKKNFMTKTELKGSENKNNINNMNMHNNNNNNIKNHHKKKDFLEKKRNNYQRKNVGEGEKL
jgi:hypothetical protein